MYDIEPDGQHWGKYNINDNMIPISENLYDANMIPADENLKFSPIQ